MLFSLYSLDKITQTSGGKYECVFLIGENDVKETIEVKSKFINKYQVIILYFILVALCVAI